jgi:DNA polymerase elongation subunit (family B)
VGSKKSRSDRSLRSLRNEKADAPAKLEPQIIVTNKQKEDEKLNTSLTIESNDKNLLVLREQRQQQPIADFICFDLEWDIETQVITAFSYVASNGASGVVLIEDHSGVEKLLLKQLLAILSRYEYCFGWYSSGVAKFNSKKKKYEGKDSDLKTLDARLKANKLESIVDLQGFPRIINPRYNGNSKLSYDQRKSLKSMIHIDAHNIYNKPMVQKQIYNRSYLGYSLNSVAKAIVSRGKFSGYSGVDFCNMSTEDKRKYSFEDSQLLYEILAHDNFRVLKQMKTISDLTGVSMEAVCNYGPSNIWKRIINEKLGKNSYTNDDNEELADYGDPEEEIESSTTWVRPKGGTVENPIKGQYKNVAVVDVSSLYPSMVILKNLSFDSVNKCRCCFDLPECQVPEEIIDRKTMTEPKYWICKKKGVFTQAMEHFTYERLRHKKAGHKLESDCLKIVINSGYGLHASKYFPYHDLNTAALITAYGRYTFKKMKEMASELGMNVIYGDTDSIFIANKDGSPTEQSKIDELITKCKEQLGVGIEHEKTFSRFLMLVKKHYVGIYNDDLKEPEIKGMEAKKSDRCEFVRKAFFQLVNDFKNDINPIPKLKEAFNKLDSKNIENPEQALLFQVKLGRNPEDYVNENDRLRIAGKQQGLAKDDVAQLYHTIESDRYIAPLDFCIDECNMIKYKESLKNVTKDILAILGYDIEKEIPSSIIKIDIKKNNRMKRAAGNKKLPIEGLFSLESTKLNKNMKEEGT